MSVSITTALRREVLSLSDTSTSAWKDWARLLAPMIVAPLLAAVATVAVLRYQMDDLRSDIGDLKTSVRAETDKLQDELKSVRAEVGAINNNNARYEERIKALQGEQERLQRYIENETGEFRARIHQVEVTMGVMQRSRN